MTQFRAEAVEGGAGLIRVLTGYVCAALVHLVDGAGRGLLGGVAGGAQDEQVLGPFREGSTGRIDGVVSVPVDVDVLDGGRGRVHREGEGVLPEAPTLVLGRVLAGLPLDGDNPHSAGQGRDGQVPRVRCGLKSGFYLSRDVAGELAEGVVEVALQVVVGPQGVGGVSVAEVPAETFKGVVER